METKKEIRKRILMLRDALPPDKRLRSRTLLTERILGHQWYYLADAILLFVSFGSEIDTSLIMEDAFRSKKRVYVPKIMPSAEKGKERMEFYRILSRRELAEGYRGIMEPAKPQDRERFLYSEEQTDKTLMLMPGVAFDPVRNRLGYGGGFYDRYLEDKPRLRTIAIGFDCQMVSAIEGEKTDIKPMQVICL